MGIPGLFFWLHNNYPECLFELLHNKNFTDIPLEVDCYSLDLNAIIHPVCQKMYGYGQPKPNPRLLHRKPQQQFIPHEKQVFSELCKTIDALRRIVNPKKQLFIAIDGVAGASKIMQQRSRRFKSGAEKDEKQAFDSSQITTGSEFMYKISRYIHVYIQRQLESNPEWQGLEVIFSNEKVAGEGEHNIIHHIKKNKNMSHCIHSPDADLIMLTIGLNMSNIYILRENIYQDINCKYFVVNVNIFRDMLLSQLRWVSDKHEYNHDQAIYDFILICFLLGNDFLPHIPSLEISNDGLNILLEMYPRVAMSNGHFVYRSKPGISGVAELSLNTKSLCEFFYALSGKEKDLLTIKAKKNIKFPDTILQSCLSKVVVGEEKTSINKVVNGGPTNGCQTLDFNRFRIEFYNKRLNGCDPYDVCAEYFKGMLFVLRYYIDGIPDWYWFYPFHYAPFFTDMYQCIGEFDGEMKFDLHTPLSSFEQLLAVLPPQSSNILPPACRPLLESDSIIADFYPLTFKVDLEGKRQEWEGHPILPFIDVDRLKRAYKSIENNLTEEEKKRVQSGKNIKYFNNNGSVRTSFYL